MALTDDLDTRAGLEHPHNASPLRAILAREGVGALLRETPLLLGIILSWWFLVTWGRAFVLMPVPVGPDWNQYFMAAWKVMHRVAGDYPEFRTPFYPWLLGALGQRMGYVHAAVVLSSVGVFLMVILAGLSARALACPAAGGLAAVSVSLVATTVEASRWAGQYAILGAGIGLAMAGGVLVARWPRVWLAAVAGLGAGLAWATDARGEPMGVASLCLVLLAMTHRGLGWRRWLFLPAFALLFSLGPYAQRRLEVIPRRDSAYLVSVQRRMAMEDIRIERVPGVIEACGQGEPDLVPMMRAWLEPCGQALLAHNRKALSAELPFGAMLSVVGLCLACLPGGRGWRGMLASSLFFGPPVAIMGVVSGLIDVPARYIVPFAVLVAAAVPVGISRFVGTLLVSRWGSWRPYVSLAVCLLALGWWWRWGPAERRMIRPLTNYSALQQVQGAMMAEVKHQLSASDRLLDCSHNLRVVVALMPRVFETDPAAVKESPDDRRCRSWANQPPEGEGERFLITDGRGFIRPGEHWEAVGTRQVEEEEGTLWRWRGAAPFAP